MEPQTESTNPPLPDQSAPSEEGLGSLMKTRDYWLVALVPLACAIAGFLSAGLASLIAGIIASFVAGIIASFVVNYFYPFATTTRRAFYTCVPALLLSAGVTLYVMLWTRGIDYLIMLIPMTCAALPVFNAGLMFFGWLGARPGVRRRV